MKTERLILIYQRMGILLLLKATLISSYRLRVV